MDLASIFYNALTVTTNAHVKTAGHASGKTGSVVLCKAVYDAYRDTLRKLASSNFDAFLDEAETLLGSNIDSMDTHELAPHVKYGSMAAFARSASIPTRNVKMALFSALLDEIKQSADIQNELYKYAAARRVTTRGGGKGAQAAKAAKPKGRVTIDKKVQTKQPKDAPAAAPPPGQAAARAAEPPALDQPFVTLVNAPPGALDLTDPRNVMHVENVLAKDVPSDMVRQIDALLTGATQHHNVAFADRGVPARVSFIPSRDVKLLERLKRQQNENTGNRVVSGSKTDSGSGAGAPVVNKVNDKDVVSSQGASASGSANPQTAVAQQADSANHQTAVAQQDDSANSPPLAPPAQTGGSFVPNLLAGLAGALGGSALGQYFGRPNLDKIQQKVQSNVDEATRRIVDTLQQLQTNSQSGMDPTIMLLLLSALAARNR